MYTQCLNVDRAHVVSCCEWRGKGSLVGQSHTSRYLCRLACERDKCTAAYQRGADSTISARKQITLCVSNKDGFAIRFSMIWPSVLWAIYLCVRSVTHRLIGYVEYWDKEGSDRSIFAFAFRDRRIEVKTSSSSEHSLLRFSAFQSLTKYMKERVSIYKKSVIRQEEEVNFSASK